MKQADLKVGDLTMPSDVFDVWFIEILFSLNKVACPDNEVKTLWDSDLDRTCVLYTDIFQECG